jgi:hypothetical protein
MAAAFTFKLDDDILGEALEVERQKEAEHQKKLPSYKGAAESKHGKSCEEQARLAAEEEGGRGASSCSEGRSTARAAVEAERLAKGTCRQGGEPSVPRLTNGS